MPPDSRAAVLSALAPERRRRFLRALDDRAAAELLYHWEFWARPAQLPPPGEWRVWMIRAGRGFGKTRAGAEWVRAQIESGACRHVALVGETAADARDVMVEGESGLLAISPPWNRPRYEPSKRRLTWPNGAAASTYSADDPEQLRGPQHDGAWADEVAKWRYADAWDQLMLGLRKGDPRCVATTTPRPKRWLKAIMDDPATIVTAGSSFDNAANLSPAFLAHMQARHGGTRLGRQELLGEYLDDTPGALWPRALIESCRLLRVPELVRVVVAIDPAAGSGGASDETGIVVAGRGRDGKGYVLADLSGRMSPDQWGRCAIDAARDWQAERIVAERNNGGDMVAHVLRTVDPTASLRTVREGGAMSMLNPVWGRRAAQRAVGVPAAGGGGGPVQTNPLIFATPGIYAVFVPAGVTSMTFALWGGGGGGGYGGGVGAGAGYIRATLIVIPLEMLTIMIASGGLAGSNSGSDGRGGGGGGLTGVFRGGTPVLIAGGGGGGAGNGGTKTGGVGGGTTGGAGQNSSYDAGQYGGGAGGTQTGGGNGGHGTVGGRGGKYLGGSCTDNNTVGSSGDTFGGGGYGNSVGYAGGGGGSGYFGGGAGGSPASSTAGGGGGGSSYYDLTALNVTNTQGSGTDPGNITHANYNGTAGKGGAANVAGGAGLVIVTW